MPDTELTVLAQVSDLLLALDDTAAQQRVLDYLVRRFGLAPTNARTGIPSATTANETHLTDSRELPGIAMVTGTGELKITVRDLKARSAADAARRLLYVTILACEHLKGEEKVSSRKVLLPILRGWRLYNGNTRTMMANDKGIVRSGDMLALDAFSRREAEEFIRQINDDSVVGKWKP